MLIYWYNYYKYYLVKKKFKNGKGHGEASLPVQIFFFDPVVLESICCRTRAQRLINESKMTMVEKNLDGSQIVSDVLWNLE